MTHGSLFSGIGGFDLAAEWMGCKSKRMGNQIKSALEKHVEPFE